MNGFANDFASVISLAFVAFQVYVLVLGTMFYKRAIKWLDKQENNEKEKDG